MRCQLRHAMKSMIAACLLSKRAQPMTHTNSTKPVYELHGTILDVDPITRELRVQVGTKVRELYVPLGCPILLNDERVKLRMLQPCDPARIVYSQEYNTCYALSVTVDCGTAASESIQRDPAAVREHAGLMECT